MRFLFYNVLRLSNLVLFAVADMTSIYAYIVSDSTRSLHVGVTRNLVITMRQYKERSIVPDDCRSGAESLIYFRNFDSLEEAVRFAHSLSLMSRSTKYRIARTINPWLEDLSADWYTMSADDEGFQFEVARDRWNVAELPVGVASFRSTAQ